MNTRNDRQQTKKIPYDGWGTYEKWLYNNERCLTRAECRKEVNRVSMDTANFMIGEWKKETDKLKAELAALSAIKKCDNCKSRKPQKTFYNAPIITWREEDHPRAKDGKFTTGSGESSSTSGTDSKAQTEGRTRPATSATASDSSSSGTGTAFRLIVPALSSTSSTSAGTLLTAASKSRAKTTAKSGEKQGASTTSSTLASPQQIKKKLAALGQTMPDVKKLHSGALNERREAYKELLSVAHKVEFLHKDAQLARTLREMGKGSVSPSYFVTNDHTLDLARDKIARHLKGEMSTSTLYRAPLNEKTAMLILLDNDPDKEEKTKANMISGLMKSVAHNEGLAQAYKDAYTSRNKQKLQEMRASLIPARYRIEANSNIKSLNAALINSKTFKKDSANWEAMNREEKKKTLGRWLQFFLSHLKIEGERKFAWKEGEGNMHVIPRLNTEEGDSAVLTLTAEEDIIAPQGILEYMEKMPMYAALFPVVHEVMHIYELQHMNGVLKNKDASEAEAEYALKTACATMGRPAPDTNADANAVPSPHELAYNSFLPESSAIYFSEQYFDALQKELDPDYEQ